MTTKKLWKNTGVSSGESLKDLNQGNDWICI